MKKGAEAPLIRDPAQPPCLPPCGCHAPCILMMIGLGYNLVNILLTDNEFHLTSQ